MTYVKVIPDKENAAEITDLLHETPVSSTSGLTDDPITIEFCGGDKCLIKYEKFRFVGADDARRFMGGLL
ncbi:hypothetical protein BACT_0521 [Bifidobacterium actinocoloniiforme DSM 22766]|uniref:Uncharacterized protein n=1 Tax=Bifidobacterium actinocoloniiforme DSM 22766 TaxID=1437605 RepID=A0A086YZX0_9BIFI|nr:hypothetical protein [Bifidobacterium actinocoloniiforme]AKV55100.1 hypothetical protein AB656_01210 [Bifidobacterium actinocoloniiforme DSM 22766]KFI39820.1 hypothetical protein BACT_0521 [Bifidobacterium actinocoloniiforme DSM 22766]